MKVSMSALGTAIVVASGVALAQEEQGEFDYVITESTVGTASPVHSSTDDVFPKVQLLPDTQHARIVPIQKLSIPKDDDDDRRPTTKKYNGFEGTGQTPWSPPDPTLAVGPNHVVETVNMNIAWWDKAGNLQFSQRLDSSGSPGFFEDVGAGDFTFDPKCVYDDQTGRFFVVALEVYSSTAFITFAISDDSDPNGTWYKYRTDARIDVGSSVYWVDYPGLGYDQDAFYVTGNLFKLSGGGPGFSGAVYRSIDKASILNGGVAVYSDIVDTGSASVQCAVNHGTSIGGYFLSGNNSTSIKVQCIKNPTTAPTLFTTTVGVSSYSSPPSAPDLGGGSIDTLDGRIINAEYRGTRLVGGHGISDSGRAVSRWYEFDTNAWPNSGSVNLAQEGEWKLGGDVFTFYPALAINAAGDIGIVSARAAADEFASVIYSVQRSGDPANSLRDPISARVSSTTYSGRWGDYFDACVDPVDDLSFWCVGEYANGGWGTWIECFDFDASIPDEGFLFSIKGDENLLGVDVDGGDIVAFDTSSNSVVKIIDIADVTTSNANIDGFALQSDGSFLISFAATENIPGLVGGPNGDEVVDEDVVRFIPTSLGEDTSGSWEFYFDGSDVGLDADGGYDIDALSVDEFGNLLVSLRGPWTLNGGALSGKDEDILQFNGSYGANTSGSFVMLLDGNDSDVRLGTGGEDIDAFSYSILDSDITLSTTDDFRVPVNIKGQDNDFITFAPTLLGSDPAGTFTFVFDGAVLGGTPDIDGVHVIE